MKTILYILFFVTTFAFGQTDSISNKINEKLFLESENPVYSILLYLENENKNIVYNEGFGTLDNEEEKVSKNSAFRIASSTKIFISTIIMQLEEEGKLQLEDKVYSYLKDIYYLNLDKFHHFEGKDYASEITIEQLLNHRSGLADIFTDKETEFFRLVFQNTKKQYSPKDMVEMYFQFELQNKPHFKPNAGWHYSDMNYLLLGLLIEKIDQVKLSQAIRNRILNPLEMKSTYFEFYEKPIENTSLVNQYVGNINFSKINTSFDWSGGGLVSNNKDLAIFIKALFRLELVNRKSLDKMVAVQFTKEHESRYGLGMYEFIVNEDVYYGHFGFYGTFVGYCPKTKTTISYSISQATPDFNSYQLISELMLFMN